MVVNNVGTVKIDTILVKSRIFNVTLHFQRLQSKSERWLHFVRLKNHYSWPDVLKRGVGEIRSIN
jgi:hypothetical protein